MAVLLEFTKKLRFDVGFKVAVNWHPAGDYEIEVMAIHFMFLPRAASINSSCQLPSVLHLYDKP